MNVALVIVAIMGSDKERGIHIYIYIILDIFYDCEALIKYDMLKELMLDKEDNIIVYVFRHLC